MIIDTKQISMPSDPAIQKKIRSALEEASASYVRIEGEKDFLKELFEDLAKDVDLPKAYLSKISKIFHKQNFNELTADQESIQELYCKIFPEAALD